MQRIFTTYSKRHTDDSEQGKKMFLYVAMVYLWKQKAAVGSSDQREANIPVQILA